MYICKTCKSKIEDSGDSQFGNKCKNCMLIIPYLGYGLANITS